MSTITIAQRALALFFNQPVDTVSCTPLAGGLDDAAVVKCDYQNISYIVKVFGNHEAGQREAAWTEHASALGIGPKFYYADPVGSYIIMEFVEGNSLIPVTANDHDTLKKIAASVALLHKSFAPFAHESDVFARINAKCKRLNVSGELKDVLEAAWTHSEGIKARIKDVAVPLAPCQNDLNPRNIFSSNNRVVIIDWGDAAMGDPYYDIAVLLILNAIGKESEKFFLEQYDAKLFEPQYYAYLQAFKQLVYFEFALNLLFSVQEMNLELLHMRRIEQVRDLNHYLTIFAQQDAVTDSTFFYSMAMASLNEIRSHNTEVGLPLAIA